MIAIREPGLRLIETPGGNFGEGLATPTRGAEEVSIIRQRQLPGGANPAHTHDREEVIVVLAGTIVVTAAGTPVTLQTGEAAIIPPGEAHRIENGGDQPAEWLLVAPAGVRFFHENGEEGVPPWAK